MDATGTTASRLPGLDVLRGAAVAMVVVNHGVIGALSVDLGAGVTGVAIFFTLSGYLITGVLVGDVQRGGGVQYARFYRNRALRLLPPLAPLLIAYAVVESVTGLLDDPRPWLSVLVGATYTADLPVLRDHTGGIAHLWTLAIEEQFYLVWPAVLAAAMTRHRVGLLTTTAIALALALPVVAAATVAHPANVYTLPTSWAFALLLGSAARLHTARIDRWIALSRVGPRVLAGAAVAVVVGTCCVRDAADTHLTYTAGVPLIAISTVVLVRSVTQWSSVPRPWAPLRALGTVSYAAYLWNLPVTFWASAALPPAAAAVVSVLGTLTLAAISWRLLERPVRDWRRRRDAGPRATSSVPEPREAESTARRRTAHAVQRPR